jgi:MADS-box transcription factor
MLHTPLLDTPSLTLLQACLNAPEPASADANGVDDNGPVDSPEDNHAQVPTGRPQMPGGAGMPPQYMTPEQALHYQNYLQQQQATNQYPMPPQGGMPRHPQQHYQPDQKLN